jgi:hypothetical protein
MSVAKKKSNSAKLPSLTSKEPKLASADDTKLPDNPFKLPADDQIFRMREEERQAKEETRKLRGHLKIWEKTQSQVSSMAERMKTLVGDDAPMSFVDLQKLEAETIAAKAAAIRRPEKENMTEFIGKKREMFLVQMSLDTKREEIRKLEEKAQMKEEALQRSEQMLEEDTMRFDAFLKENDKKAHDAIKRAEDETKKKQEKNTEIKRLNQQIQALNSEMSKHREALDDCLHYKEFLDMLTPPEHFEAHRRSLIDKRDALKKERFDKKYRIWEQQRRRLIETHRKEVESRKEGKRERRKISPEEEEEEEEKFRNSLPLPPRIEDELVEIEQKDPPMYFTQPSQLMDIFAALEEQNLFLIQNSQDTQYTLDELRLAFKNTKISMDSRTEQLHEQIGELQGQIDAEEQRARTLQAKRAMAMDTTTMPGAQGHGISHVEKEHLLEELNNKVQQVYEACEFNASSKPSTLYMLSQLESKLEILLAEIERMPQDYVIKSEKEKDKKRRERKREEQHALQERLQEERNRRAVERSMQAPKKRIGRLVMARSRPIRKEFKTNDDGQVSNDNNDDFKYLS